MSTAPSAPSAPSADTRPPLPLLEAAISAFCLWQAAPPLLNAWLHAPLDRLGWLALALWSLPLVLQRGPAANHRGQGPLLGAALGAGLLGTLADLNALAYLGLALALVSWRACRWPHLLWLAAAPAWMPAFGWLLHNFFSPPLIAALRLTLAAAASVLVLLLRKSHPDS